MLARSQHHDHLATFETGLGLDLGVFLGFGTDLQQEITTDLLVGHFPTAETQRDLDLVAIVEEPAHRLHLHVIVMLVDVWPHLDFFDVNGLLLLTRFGSLFLFLILELAEVENLADRRVGVRRNLD